MSFYVASASNLSSRTYRSDKPPESSCGIRLSNEIYNKINRQTFVMTCPSVSVPQNSRSADEKLAGHCACALSSGEKNKTDMSFRWTRGKGGLKGSWQGHAHTHTCRDTSDGSILWAPRAFSLILSTWPWASPPQTLSSPSRSVALFVIVIQPVFVKGSLAVCSRWWVYVCARVCVCKSQPAEGVPWHHCRRVFCHTL